MATPPRADPPKHPQQHQPDPRQSQQQANTQRPGQTQQPSRPGSDPVSGVGPGGSHQPQHDQPQTSKTSTGDKEEERQANREAEGKQHDHAREERESREKHEAEERQRRERGDERREGQRLHARDDEEDDSRKGDEQKRPKRAILPEGQAHQLFYNGHKIAREQDPPTQWLSMGRLGDGTPVVQSPMTPELEQRLKEGKFYLADNVSDDPPAPPARRDPL